jgi:hypothetical protein
MRRKDTLKWQWAAMLAAVMILAGGSAREAEAQPVYVVDTGPGASSGGLSLFTDQFLAGQFTLDVGHEINAFEGWMVYLNIVNNMPVHLVVYGDANGIPDWTDVVFTQLFFVPPSGFAPGWHGVQGLELPLYGGTYWLAFELDPGAIGSGAMPPTTVQMLDHYAVDQGMGWFIDDTANLGIRVLPEPGLSVMLVSGLVPLVAACRRRRVGSLIQGPAGRGQPVA